MANTIYLDCAAHMPAEKEVLDAFCAAECAGNPSSLHALGRQAKAIMDGATASIAGILGVKPEEIIFTSGASESNNLAIKGFARAGRYTGKHIISTPLEHPSVSGALTFLQEQGHEIDLLHVKRNGEADTEHLRELLRKDTALVALTAVDSELGAVQPVAEIANILKEYPNCRFHVDAAQAVGKIPFDFHLADSVSVSPHKFGGICGSGMLYKREKTVLEPLIHGGASTTIYRSGTPAVSLAVSAAKALELALGGMDDALRHVQTLQNLLRGVLGQYPLVRVNSPENAVPHILNLSVKGVKGEVFQKMIDDHGVCVSVKSACSVPNTPSRAVFAVSRDKSNALCSWRISMSRRTTQEEIMEFLRIFDHVYKESAHETRA
ncbi:MAG: cysteine desulfurase [Oscillospiraceae bacterium]|jgi:cysteine desulfurase|nr:cysteine desulfurase [Oscillospiraceae bacterium]